MTHDSLRDLEACLPGQLAAARDLDCPIVVVDNASRDRGPAFARDRLDSARGETLGEMGRTAGYAAAVNAALAEVPGMDLMLLNPDVEVSGTDGITGLRDFMASHPRVAVAAPRLIDAEGQTQASARRFPSPLTMLGSSSLGRRIGPFKRAYENYLKPVRGDEPRTVDWAIGAALLVRREACDEVGGWDEGYFLYVEDVDFCLRCWRAGWHVAYVPAVSFRHRHERASSQAGVSALRSHSRRHHIRGLLRLWSKEPALLAGRGRNESKPLGSEGPGEP